MSVRVLTEVFAHSRATLSTRLVLLALADSAHDDGVTWAGQKTLAAKTLVSEQSVRRCLRDLEASGEIETRKAQRGQVRINVYRVIAPGLIDPEYDRLPFELDAPFTTAQYLRSSDSDDRANLSDDRANPLGTTAHIAHEPAIASYKGLNSKQETRKDPPISPPAVEVAIRADSNRPTTVNRKTVTDAEYQSSLQILEYFNHTFDTRYSGEDWHRKIIARLREHPELPLEAHDVVIRRAHADPWWNGPASPSIVYGNSAQFERSVHAVRVDLPPRMATAADWET